LTKETEKGWRGYMFKKMHTPHKFRTKYARRKGWQYEDGLNYSNEHVTWFNNEKLETEVYPYKMGFDSAEGPVRHRDYRSNYHDVPKEQVLHWYHNRRGAMEQNHIKGNFKEQYVYKKIYAKIGPQLPEEMFPFKLNDLVELVAGRDKGKRGPIMYIDEPNNYIVVAGCNIDYLVKDQYPREIGMLPEHIRLVNPETDELVEDIEILTDYDYNLVRRCKATKTQLPWDSDHEGIQKGKNLVTDGKFYHCETKDYPTGDLDTMVDVFRSTGDDTWREGQHIDYEDYLNKKPESIRQTLHEEMMDIHGLKGSKKKRKTYFY